MSTPTACPAPVFAPWPPAIVPSRGRNTAMRRAAAALAAVILGACDGQEPSTLWQLSPAAGIRGAVYDSVGTVGDLRRHGNHGLGTAAHLNGEMVAVDGVFYRVDASGVAIAVADSQPVTFGIVTKWRGGTPITVERGLRYCFGCDIVSAGDTTFQTSMNGKLVERFGTTNWFYSLRLEGPFVRVVTRTFAEQKGDPCWNSVLATEVRDTFTNVAGTMVGFYEPAFANGTSIAGYHLHFITPSAPAGADAAYGGGDSLYGGHVVSFTTGERVRLQAAPVRHFELEVPSIDEYKRADLSGACTPDSQNAAARQRASASPPDPSTLNRPASAMHRVRRQDLPFRGSSHRFVGAEQGDTGISVFLFNGGPGSGPGPHRHPYDEVQFIQSGRGRYTVEGETFEAGAGDILVIKAGEVHGFTCIGDEPLVQMDVHLSPDFIQENLG